jgi:amino acid transporter
MTIIEVGGLLLTIFIGLPYIGSVNYFEIRNISGIFEASTLVFFAFLGFEDIVKLSQETRFPERNIPYEALSTSSAPLADVASVALGSDVFLVMSIVALFSTANTSLLMMLGGSRILYGIAESGSLPHVFSRIHPKRQTPWAAILAITLFSILFLFIGDITVVANISNFMIFIIFFVVNISLIRLRYREPDVKRPFKSPINIGRFAVLPALGAISTVFLFSHLSIEVMIYGSILLIAGVIISLFSNHNT